MIIHGYVLSFADEADVLPNALNSMAHFCDKIYVADGGLEGTLVEHPRYTQPIKDWLTTRHEFSGYGAHFFTVDTVPWSKEAIEAFKKAVKHPIEDGKIVVAGDMTLELSGVKWMGIPIKVWEHPFENPGKQRNWILNKMLEEPEQPDWIVWLDSDDIASHEMINDIRPFLESLPKSAANVLQPYINLVVDDNHMGMPYPDWLFHSRIHKPKTVKWQERWHEHQFYKGVRAHWEAPVIHTRFLFRNRLLRRGHKTVEEAWKGVMTLPLEDVATFDLEWPKEEPRGLTVYQEWNKSVFGYLAHYRVILVSGPQRSGTRICAKMIARDTGFRYIDEVDFQVENKKAWEKIVEGENGIVVQCPSMTRYIDQFGQEDDVAVVWMLRPIKDIIQSQERIGWTDAEKTSLKKYDKEYGSACVVKYKYFDKHQRDNIKHLYEIQYDDLRVHDLWIDKRDRSGFNWNQTERKLGVKIK